MSVHDEEKLLREFKNAGDNLRKCLGTTQGGVAAETRYGEAYKALVRAGLAPKLRAKYHRRVTGR